MSYIPGHELIFVIFKTNFVTSLPTLDFLSNAQIIANVGQWSCIHIEIGQKKIKVGICKIMINDVKSG